MPNPGRRMRRCSAGVSCSVSRVSPPERWGVGTRILTTLHFGVEATDPATFAATGSSIIVIGGPASCLPRRQANRRAPVRSLVCAQSARRVDGVLGPANLGSELP